MPQENHNHSPNSVKGLLFNPASEGSWNTLHAWLSRYQLECRRLKRLRKPAFGNLRLTKYQNLRGDLWRNPKGEKVINRLLKLMPGSLDWAESFNMCAPCAPSTTASLFAILLSAHLNPNIGWDQFSGKFAEAEILTIRSLARLIGFSERRAGGLSTYGGAGTILYALRAALEKSSKRFSKERLKIVITDTAHFSIRTAARWLGYPRDCFIVLKRANGKLNGDYFYTTCKDSIAKKHIISCIMLEFGTTDSFYVDDVASIVNITKQLRSDCSLDYAPHIHVDAVIGWVYCFFKGYDMRRNFLHLGQDCLETISRLGKLSAGISMADSAGLDFHKLGFVPLVSSFCLFKDKTALFNLGGKRRIRRFTTFGSYTPTHYSLEGSRSASGVITAFTNLQLLGKEGYQRLLASCLETAHFLRRWVRRHPTYRIINASSEGPVVVLRLYASAAKAAAELRIIAQGSISRKQKRILRSNDRFVEKRFKNAVESWGDSVFSLIKWTPLHENMPGSCKGSAIRIYLANPLTGPSVVRQTLRRLDNSRFKKTSK